MSNSLNISLKSMTESEIVSDVNDTDVISRQIAALMSDEDIADIEVAVDTDKHHKNRTLLVSPPVDIRERVAVSHSLNISLESMPESEIVTDVDDADEIIRQITALMNDRDVADTEEAVDTDQHHKNRSPFVTPPLDVAERVVMSHSLNISLESIPESKLVSHVDDTDDISSQIITLMNDEHFAAIEKAVDTDQHHKNRTPLV
jgi:hypothetical protein